MWRGTPPDTDRPVCPRERVGTNPGNAQGQLAQRPRWLGRPPGSASCRVARSSWGKLGPLGVEGDMRLLGGPVVIDPATPAIVPASDRWGHRGFTALGRDIREGGVSRGGLGFLKIAASGPNRHAGRPWSLSEAR